MKKVIWLIFIILIAIVGLLFYIQQDNSTSSNKSEEKVATLNIHFLDIGQGDATLIDFTNGEQMLIDCAIDARIIEALGRVMDFYDKYIDYLVITHPDADHYGGCIDVLERFDIGMIIVTGLEKEGHFFDSYWQAVEREGAEIVFLTKEDSWDIASTTIHWLYPDHDIREDSHIPGVEKETNANDTSIVMKVSYGEVDILLTGDAEEAAELYLVDTAYDDLDVEILKAGHHGSNTSSIPPFIEATSPKHVIFSAGRENNFGHPSLRVIRRVERAGAQVWRTDTQGDILLEIRNNEIWLNKEHFYVDKDPIIPTRRGR